MQGTIRNLYNVETDDSDWPTGLTDEDYKRVPSFKDAALLDWTYGVVVRACRAAGCEPMWHAPEKT